MATVLQRVGGIHDQIEKSPRGRRAGSGQELDDAKAGGAVARVLGPAQKCQNVLDVRGFEEFEAAEFDEWDIAARELDFERVRCDATPETTPPAP